MKERRLESVYVMSTEATYIDKTRNNQIADLWHMRLGQVGYSKLDMTIKKSTLKGLSKLEVKTNTVWASC